MATDAAPGGAQRPRPWLLVLLGIAVAAFLVSRTFSGGGGGAAVRTTPPRAAAGAQAAVDPAELDVKIESLKQPPAAPADGNRNPFRFQPKAPPPPPPQTAVKRAPVGPLQPPGPVGDPPPAPIGTLIKFIGIVDTGNAKIGAFSDCRYTFPGREGEVIEGRFRVVRIGVESAIVEYTDGRGRTTLPLNGQGCIGKS